MISFKQFIVEGSFNDDMYLVDMISKNVLRTSQRFKKEVWKLYNKFMGAEFKGAEPEEK